MAIDVGPDKIKGPDGVARVPVIAPGHTLTTVTDQISDAVLKRPVSKGLAPGHGHLRS